MQPQVALAHQAYLAPLALASNGTAQQGILIQALQQR